jgi:aspartate aminotransferase-like enzyme
MAKFRLMAPGPAMIPEQVYRAMTENVIHHRSSEFRSVVQEVEEGLQYVFQTKNKILIFTASGTGAMESTVANLFSPEDKVLVVQAGSFGERWAQICKNYGLSVKTIDVEWGRAVNPKLIEQRLKEDKEGKIKGVFTTHTETSTGVETDMREIGKIVAGYNALLICDAVSGMACCNLETDAWQIDVVVSGCQKGLMTPPGLSYVSLSESAWKAHKKAKNPRFYFDYTTAQKFLESYSTPYSPAISLLYGQREALRMIREEGLPNVLARHERLARATRAAVQAMNLSLFSINHTNNVTVVNEPDGVKVDDMRQKILQKFGIYLAGGQGSLLGKVFRIGHMGYCDAMDIISTISALDITLTEMGHIFNQTQGIKAAEDILKEE